MEPKTSREKMRRSPASAPFFREVGACFFVPENLVVRPPPEVFPEPLRVARFFAAMYSSLAQRLGAQRRVRYVVW